MKKATPGKKTPKKKPQPILKMKMKDIRSCFSPSKSECRQSWPRKEINSVLQKSSACLTTRLAKQRLCQQEMIGATERHANPTKTFKGSVRSGGF